MLARFEGLRADGLGEGGQGFLPGTKWKEALAAFTQAIGPQTLETREHLLGGTARRFYRIGDNA